MAVQCHVENSLPADVLLSRLDKLSTPGVPVWITDLDYAHFDEQTQANVLENTLRAAFR